MSRQLPRPDEHVGAMCACGHPAAGHHELRAGGAVIVWNPADGTASRCGESRCQCRVIGRVPDHELPGQTNIHDAITASEW